MKSAFTVLTVLLSTVVVATATPFEVSAAVDSKANWHLQGFRGTYAGYTDAFFQDAKKEKTQCFDNSTADSMLNIINFFDGTHDISQAFGLIGDAMIIFNNLKSCNITESFTVIKKHCASKEGTCSPSNLVGNLTKNIFVFIGKITQLTTVLKGYPAADAQAYYTQTYAIGDDVGTFVRVVVGYEGK